MHEPITDHEWQDWLCDLEPYYGTDRPLAEAFLRLSRRCADAEADRDTAQRIIGGMLPMAVAGLLRQVSA